MLVGQPSEETIDGAKAMMADRLYERFGTPDLAIALHDTSTLPAGMVGITPAPRWQVPISTTSPCAASAVMAPLPKRAKTPS